MIFAAAAAVADAVSVALAPEPIEACSVLLSVPAVVPSVQITVARPLVSVVTVAEETEPPPAVAEKVTVSFATRLPLPSVTSTTGAGDTAVPTAAEVPPDTKVIFAAAAAAFKIADPVAVPLLSPPAVSPKTL